MPAKEQQPTLIIGLVGLAGSGKDTVAEMLMNNWERDQHFHARMAFAFPIRKTFVGLLRCAGVKNPEQWAEGEKKEQTAPILNISYRQFAQTFGTEYAHEHMGRDVWIRAFESRMQAQVQSGVTHFVVPDVRFAVESDWLRDQGAVLWRIERPDARPVREHVSEAGIASIRTHRTILNDGSIDDLRKAVGFELAKLYYEQGLLA